MWDQACMWGFIDAQKYPLNPTKYVKRYPEEKRDVTVPKEKIADLLAAINSYEGENAECIRIAIGMFLVTGLRHREVTRVEWTEIDFEKKLLFVTPEKSKNKKPHSVPLPDFVLARIAQLPRKSKFVFPGRKLTPVNIHLPFARILEDAGMEVTKPDGTPTKLRIHDLRRTVGQYLLDAGAEMSSVSRVLGHSKTSTTEAAYARVSNIPSERIRGTLEGHTNRILSLVKG